MKKIIIILPIVLLTTIFFNFQSQKEDIVQLSGCCSHHGGVCGCVEVYQGGRKVNKQLCCDGHPSYSCFCGE